MSVETLYAQLRDAVFDNDKARLQELLRHDGVDVDHFDAGGQTLLHLACFWGRMDLVKVLLNAGASLKTKNAASCTALDLATHWGHSAVAEVIRLRGGRSVWEEKLGHLQVEAEELKLQAQQSQTQYLDKKRDLEALATEYDSLHTRFEEAKSARVLAECAVVKAQGEVLKQTTEVARLQAALEEMTANCHAALIEKAKAQHLQQESLRETSAVIAHRDEVLRAMQESVAKQEASAYGWQRAEVAAAIAESQRNFAFADRDRFQKKHVAALAELVVVTAKLDAAEEELMALKSDLAEHIYEKRREKTSKKRAERALSNTLGDGVGGGNKPDSPGPTGSSAKKKNAHFSLAAREFGERLRAEEVRKQKERAKRLTRVENQYLMQGLSAPLRASEQFQQEFVATVQSFSTSRNVKWKELKKERDRQAWFTRSVLARPIATAPHLLGGGGSSTLLEGDSEEQDSVGTISSSPAAPGNGSKAGEGGSVNFGIYRKYARPAYLDNSLRPVTSPLEVRMEHSFFASPPREDDTGFGNEGNGRPEDKEADTEPSKSVAKVRADCSRSEQPQVGSSSLGSSASAPSFLPVVTR